METIVTVLGVRKVNFVSKEGKKIQGTKVFYSPQDSADKDIIGHNVLSEWFKGFEVFNELSAEKIPGNFKLSHTIQMHGSKPKVKIKEILPAD